MYHWYKHNLLHWWFLSRGQSTTKLTHFGLSVPVIVHINKHFTGYPASQLHVKIQGKWNSSSCHTCASDFSFIRSFLKHLSLKKKKKKSPSFPCPSVATISWNASRKAADILGRRHHHRCLLLNATSSSTMPCVFRWTYTEFQKRKKNVVYSQALMMIEKDGFSFTIFFLWYVK